MGPKKIMVLVPIALLGAPLAANAALVTYQVDGTINEVSNTFGGLPSGFSSASTGEQLVLTFTVDTSTAPNYGSTANSASYANAVVSETATIGGTTLTPSIAGGQPSSVVGIMADQASGSGAGTVYTTQYEVIAGSTQPANYTGVDPSWELNESIGTRSPTGFYTNASLSDAPLSLFQIGQNGFAEIYLNYDGYVNGSYTAENSLIRADVTSISAVPIPASVWLLVSGIGSLGALARKKRAA
jgi:hypothetical protein